MVAIASDYAALPSSQPANAVNSAVEAGKTFWGSEGFSFKSILDAINPLQQLPIVSNIYRSLTGDTIAPGSRLTGGALYGGPVGFLASLMGAIVEGQTGSDIGGSLIAMATKKEDDRQLADNRYLDAPQTAYQRQAYSAYLRSQSLLS